MSRATAVLTAFLLFGGTRAFAQTDVAGEWAASLATPRGEMAFTLVILQNGSKLSGRMTSEMGEFPLEGLVNGNQVKIEWSFPDGGKMLPVTFTGRVQGDSMSGFAKLGNVGEGSMSARRSP